MRTSPSIGIPLQNVGNPVSEAKTAHKKRNIFDGKFKYKMAGVSYWG